MHRVRQHGDLHRAGTCVIDANQAGNATYAAAPHVQQTITVKQAQSITFNDPPTSGSVGGEAELRGSGGGSGNPVVLTASSASAGVCRVNDYMVNYIAAGVCVIDANQAGNATYWAATPVQQMITVKQAQSITFNDPPASGATGGSATVSAAASSGLPVVLAVGNPEAGVCTVSDGKVTYAAAGPCIIDANQAGNATYAAAPQAQLIIKVVNLDLTADTALTVPD